MTRWTDHVRAYAAAHNISYKQSVIDSKQSYDYNIKSKCPIKVRNLEHESAKYKEKYKKCKRTLRGRVDPPAGPPPAPPPPPLPPPPPPRRKPGSPPSYEESKKDKYKTQPGPKYKKPKQEDKPPGYDEKEEEFKGEPDQWNPPDYVIATRPPKPTENPPLFADQPMPSGNVRMGNVAQLSDKQLEKVIKNKGEKYSSVIISAAKKWLKWRADVREHDWRKYQEDVAERVLAETNRRRAERGEAPLSALPPHGSFLDRAGASQEAEDYVEFREAIRMRREREARRAEADARRSARRRAR